MTEQDLKTLREIHRLMQKIEQNHGAEFSATLLAELARSLDLFSDHENLELRKISEISKHLHPQMNLKHYVSFMVPIERLLQKSLRDDEFLIFSSDKEQGPIEKIPLIFLLDNLRSAFNVGSIFRSAECFAAEKIYLCGYTPLPSQEKLAKTAMGTDTLVPWEYAPKIWPLILSLKDQGYRIVALETTSHAASLETAFTHSPTALVLGNERFGLDTEVLKMCSEVRQIPLRGQKNSLNVGVAAGIAAYEFSKQWSLQK